MTTSDLSEKKISNKFNKLIKCYHKFCSKYGYSSWTVHTLIKFLHEKGFKTDKHLIKDDGHYYLVYKDFTFELEDLLGYFKL